MKKKEWNEGLNHLDPSLVEKYIEQKDRLRQKNSHPKSVWLRVGAVAACFLLIVSAVIVVPMLRENEPGIIPNPNIPIVNIQIPSNAPQYYGTESSSGTSEGGQTDVDPTGISVTAKLIEALPDVYTFFDDWNQDEFRLLRMQTIKLLKGQEMTEEFYYLIPVNFFTDFSVFDCFVIKNMAQFSYEHSVLYNQTQGAAEQLNLVIFGYRVHGYTALGENITAFDVNGNFDERLWKANTAWISATERSPIMDTLVQAEKAIQENEWEQDLYVHLLKDISGKAETVLEDIKTFDNGIFVPQFSTNVLYFSPEVQFHATKYINGFATNEQVSVWCKEWAGGDQDTYAYTKARFGEDDMNRLPDLALAFESVKGALNDMKAPHFDNREELRNTTSGIFGWYAKTETGVIGIIRVTWCFYTEKQQFYYDDAYYIIEYGANECNPISRDALLELLGEYEATYIYTGEYNEYGKCSNTVSPEI